MRKKKLFIICIITLFISIIPVEAKILNCNNPLRSGSKGASVKTLQTMLNQAMNCNLEKDGKFGPLTKQCVITFQTKYNLQIDGKVGPETCSKLNSLVGSKVSSGLDKDQAIVTGDVVNVRKKPNTSSQILTTVTRGSKVKLVKTTGNWYRIKTTSGQYGYIRSDLLTRDLIIVDISDQALYFFEDGNKSFQALVVTGMKGSHDTPTGKYTLKKSSLARAQTLRGTNDDGSKYASYVEYWMPFILSRGIGFHDASWRNVSEYNDSQYKNDGSHGCINMQREDAKRLYQSIKKDTAVIIRK